MAIIVEDGTGVDNANSYASVGELRDYAEARGLPFDADVAEQALIRAMDYIEARAGSIVGTRLYRLSWPRRDALVYGDPIEENVIPNDIKLAQLAAAVVAQTTELLPVIPANARGAIRERKVGPITTVYAVSRESGSRPVVPLADAYLAPYEWSPAHLKVYRG